MTASLALWPLACVEAGSMCARTLARCLKPDLVLPVVGLWHLSGTYVDHGPGGAGGERVYNSIIPLPLSLGHILARLQGRYYRQPAALLHDLDTCQAIVACCFHVQPTASVQLTHVQWTLWWLYRWRAGLLQQHHPPASQSGTHPGQAAGALLPPAGCPAAGPGHPGKQCHPVQRLRQRPHQRGRRWALPCSGLSAAAHRTPLNGKVCQSCF